MSNKSYASLGNYNKSYPGTVNVAAVSKGTPSMANQDIHINNQNNGYNALSPRYKGREYNAITDSYGSSCGKTIQAACVGGRCDAINANEYYHSNSKDVRYRPVQVRGPWNEVKGLYELNPQADTCIVNKHRKKPEYYDKNKELIILSADSWCPWSVEQGKEIEAIKNALAELGVMVKYVSDKDNKEEFDRLSKKFKARGYPHHQHGSKSYPGYHDAHKIKQKIQDDLSGDKKPEYYNSEHKLEIYGMEGCPHCVKVKKSLDEIKRLLKEIGVEVDYISSKEQPDKFKAGAVKHELRGFPGFSLDNGDKTWLGARGVDDIKQKVQDHLSGGKQQVGNNNRQKSSGDGKDMIIVSADSWCSYSMSMKKELEAIKRSLADLGVRVTYVSDKDNKSDFDKYSSKYNVRGYPTIIFDAGGKLEDVWPGYVRADKLKDKVKTHMAKSDGEKKSVGNGGNAMLVCISADDWCGYSKKLSASKDELAQKLGANGIILNMVNATENKPEFDRLSKEHNVRGFPHSLLIVDGKKVADISGYRPPEGMLQECMKNL